MVVAVHEKTDAERSRSVLLSVKEVVSTPLNHHIDGSETNGRKSWFGRNTINYIKKIK